MPGVVDVRFVEREPAEKRNLLSWEQVILLTDEICIENNEFFFYVLHCCQCLFALRKTTAFCQKTCVTSI